MGGGGLKAQPFGQPGVSYLQLTVWAAPGATGSSCSPQIFSWTFSEEHLPKTRMSSGGPSDDYEVGAEDLAAKPSEKRSEGLDSPVPWKGERGRGGPPTKATPAGLAEPWEETLGARFGADPVSGGRVTEPRIEGGGESNLSPEATKATPAPPKETEEGRVRGSS